MHDVNDVNAVLAFNDVLEEHDVHDVLKVPDVFRST